MGSSILSEKIKANFDYLTENTIDIYSLVERLARKNVLTNSERGQILNESKNPNDQLKAARLYYAFSKSKNPETFQTVIKTLIKTGNYAAAFYLQPKSMTKLVCSEVGGSRAKKFEFQKYQKSYLTHLKITDSTLDLDEFVKEIADYKLLEKIRMINVWADTVKYCSLDGGDSSSALAYSVTLKKLVHFECGFWFESKDTRRYGQFIWPQEIINLDLNKLIFFRKSKHEKRNNFEDRLTAFFGANYVELTVNKQVLVLADRQRNLKITPTLDYHCRSGSYFLPPSIISELKELFRNNDLAVEKFCADIAGLFIASKDLSALKSPVCEKNKVLKLRLLMTFLTFTNSQELLNAVPTESKVAAILRKTILSSSKDNILTTWIPSSQQITQLTHVRIQNQKFDYTGFNFPSIFENCTYLQSIILEGVQHEYDSQFYSHIYLANLKKFYLSQIIQLPDGNNGIVDYLIRHNVGYWKEMLFCDESTHDSDDYMNGRRPSPIDIRLQINGYLIAFTDLSRMIHVITREEDYQEIVNRSEYSPSIDECCAATINMKQLMEGLRYNNFFSHADEKALERCPDELKIRLIYSLQAFGLRDTLAFVNCLTTTGNIAVANMFRPTTLEIVRETFAGVAIYRQQFLTHLTLSGAYIDWTKLHFLLVPCIFLQYIKMEDMEMRMTSLGGRCVLPALRTFIFDGLAWFDTAADLKAFLFFEPIPGRTWRMDELWSLGINITLIIGGITYLSINHIAAELIIKYLAHSAEDIFRGVDVNLNALTLGSAKLATVGYIPKTQGLKSLSLDTFELTNTDRFLAGCPQMNALNFGLPYDMDFLGSWNQVRALRKLDLGLLPRSMDTLRLVATQLTTSLKVKVRGPLVVENLYLWGTELNKKATPLRKFLQATNCFLFEHDRSVLKNKPISPAMLSALMCMQNSRWIFYSRMDTLTYDKKFAAYTKQFGLKGTELSFILTKTGPGQWIAEAVTQTKQVEALSKYIEGVFQR